jgi:hypothetical protein
MADQGIEHEAADELRNVCVLTFGSDDLRDAPHRRFPVRGIRIYANADFSTRARASKAMRSRLQPGPALHESPADLAPQQAVVRA